MDPTKIDWWQTTTSAIGGAFAAVVALFGWFGRKMSAFDTRIKAIEEATAECRIHQSVQAEQHKENQRRLCRIEDGIIAADEKLDQILFKQLKP